MTAVLGTDVGARRAAHEARVDAWVAPVLERRSRGEKHAVEDFLFSYYRLSPARLRAWTPGPGVVVAGERPGPQWAPSDGGWVLGPPSDRVRRLAGEAAALLARTAARPPRFGCFGLHEWAMVHRGDDVRHPVPLRLGQAGTDAVVEAMPIACSHYDAFRFFAPSATGLNALQPTRETQVDHEQPGCLHATMDLYQHAYQLLPWVASELVADCFALARDVRVVDMRASPYDLSSYGLAPIAVETPEGRAQYVREQRAFTLAVAPLRDRLLTAAGVLGSVPPEPPRRSADEVVGQGVDGPDALVDQV